MKNVGLARTLVGTVIGEPHTISWSGHQSAVFILGVSTSEGYIDELLCIGERSLVAQIRNLRVGSRIKATGRMAPIIDEDGRANALQSDNGAEVPAYGFLLAAIEPANE